MKRLLKICFCVAAFVLPISAQQVGYIDLTVPPPVLKKMNPEKGLPDGCSKLGGGFFDGAVNPDDGKKREITLELTKLSYTNLSEGSEFETEVRLTNTSTHSIEIPWSSDPAIVEAGPDPDHARYENAEFGIQLVDRGGTVVWLKPLSGSLFGSQFITGSMRRIAPGEWVVAKIKFKVYPKYLEMPVLKKGAAQFTVWWNQQRHGRSLKRTECELWASTFLYNDFYEQKSLPTVVTIQ
jgi:hypothetical protein